MDQQKWGDAEAQVAQVIENPAAGINKAAEDFETEMTRSGSVAAPPQSP
jgi:hypothetical protein